MQRWRPDPTVLGGMRACGDLDGGVFVEWHFVKQALAEKDAALAKAVEEIAELNVRVDALRRWLRERDAAYQQLMEKAIRFAERLDAVDKNSSVHWNDVDEFLKSPEVQAWKEKQT